MKDHNPQGTPRQWDQGKPNLGPTPMKIRELPPFPHRMRETGSNVDDDIQRSPERSNAMVRKDDADGQPNCTVRGAVNDPPLVRALPMTEAHSPLRSKSASPRVRRGALNVHFGPPAHNEVPAEKEDTMCNAYAYLTNRCWVKLIRFSERLDQ